MKLIYPENLGLLGLFLSEIEKIKKCTPTPIGTIVSNKVIFLKMVYKIKFN